jgi:hypothetical protein
MYDMIVVDSSRYLKYKPTIYLKTVVQKERNMCDILGW